MNLIEELRWRGMIQDIMPGTEEQLLKEQTSAYIGFDPTAESLHIGSLVPILLLVHLQKAGHKPYALIGGATGMIGDPTGKSEERNLLSEDVLQRNQNGIKKQLEKFLAFDENQPNAAVMVNNYDWFKGMFFLDFIRDTGKHITVNYMMAKDSVKKRIESDNGISFTEFTYQLIQGYDFYWLYKNHNCKLQMGGSDQWGNITTGAELIRRRTGGEAFAFTCPLLKKADGGKFGKSEKGNIWLDAEKTSPYQFYQFWLNAADDDAKKWIKIFTFLNQEIIESLILTHDSAPELRLLQKTLAEHITTFVHGIAGLNQALDSTRKLFEKQNLPVESLSKEDLETIEGIQKIPYPLSRLISSTVLEHFLVETNIMPSRGEARKMILNGGIRINKNKIDYLEIALSPGMLLHKKYILVQKGKKNFYLIQIYNDTIQKDEDYSFFEE
ncbi:tyrosine--tRNA ligase [Parafilimonas sp.]|uniref:tyrosine--tRNA ligase n=1 Tax=Parafilimonas sp. TaxID=1969739 RepID=UPI0039E66C63